MTRPDDHDDTFDAEGLLRDAGRRPELDEEHLETIQRAFRAAWQSRFEPAQEAAPNASPEAVRSTGRRSLVAVAAMAVAVLGLGWWWVGTGPEGPSPESGSGWIARVARVQGDVRWLPPSAGEAEWRRLETGRDLPAGARLRTGSDPADPSLPPGASLGLGDSQASLRIDQGSSVIWNAGGVVDLERGAVYVDSGDPSGGDPPSGAPSAPTLEVRTPLGVVTEVGTQFEVRLTDDSHLRVRVREGAVSLVSEPKTGAPSVHAIARAGETLLLDGAGDLERGTTAIHGPSWDWVVAGAPSFDLEGRTVADFLDWVARETGWTVRIPDPELARQVDGIVLYGSMGGAAPDRAPELVLPAAGLRSSLDDGTLSVTWADDTRPTTEP